MVLTAAPIFLIVVLGYLLRRLDVPGDGFGRLGRVWDIGC